MAVFRASAVDYFYIILYKFYIRDVQYFPVQKKGSAQYIQRYSLEEEKCLSDEESGLRIVGSTKKLTKLVVNV